jgi:hypothetical protein
MTNVHFLNSCPGVAPAIDIRHRMSRFIIDPKSTIPPLLLSSELKQLGGKPKKSVTKKTALRTDLSVSLCSCPLNSQLLLFGCTAPGIEPSVIGGSTKGWLRAKK